MTRKIETAKRLWLVVNGDSIDSVWSRKGTATQRSKDLGASSGGRFPVVGLPPKLARRLTSAVVNARRVTTATVELDEIPDFGDDDETATVSARRLSDEDVDF